MGRGKRKHCDVAAVGGQTSDTAPAAAAGGPTADTIIKIEQPVTRGQCVHTAFSRPLPELLGAVVTRHTSSSSCRGGKGTGHRGTASRLPAEADEHVPPEPALHIVAPPAALNAQTAVVAQSTAVVAVAVQPAVTVAGHLGVNEAAAPDAHSQVAGLGATAPVRGSVRNDFDYKRRSGKFPNNVVAKWDELAHDKTPGVQGRRRKFIADIMEVADGNYDAVVYKQDSVAGKRTTLADSEEWISWVVFERDEGRVSAMEQITSKSVDSQRHPGLPVDSALKWPEDQQIMRRRCIKTNSEYTGKQLRREIELESEAHTESVFSTLTQAVDAHMHPVATPAHSAAASAVQSSPRSLEDVALQTKALQSIRNGHRAWDSASIDFKLLHGNAAEHPDVSAALLGRFEESRTAADATDKKIMGIETSYRTGVPLDVDGCKTLADQLASDLKLCKSIGKKLTACIKG